MVSNMYANTGHIGYEMIFGNTPDISEYVECVIQSYTYLNTETRERLWFTNGHEWDRERAGCEVISVRALYGLESSRAE